MTRRENTAEQTRGSFSRNNLVTGPMEGEGTEEGGVFVYSIRSDEGPPFGGYRGPAPCYKSSEFCVE